MKLKRWMVNLLPQYLCINLGTKTIKSDNYDIRQARIDKSKNGKNKKKPLVEYYLPRAF